MPSGASSLDPTGARRPTLRQPRHRVGPRRVRAGIAITTVFHEVLHPDITAVPLEGVAPSHVVVAIRVGDRSRLVAAFRNLAQVHLTGPEPHLTLRPCCVTDQTV